MPILSLLLKKGDCMNDRDFGKYAFLIVAVVAVVGLLSTGGQDMTGFATKVAKETQTAAEPAPRTAANYWCEKAKANYANVGCDHLTKPTPKCQVLEKDVEEHCEN